MKPKLRFQSHGFSRGIGIISKTLPKGKREALFKHGKHGFARRSYAVRLSECARDCRDHAVLLHFVHGCLKIKIRHTVVFNHCTMNLFTHQINIRTSHKLQYGQFVFRHALRKNRHCDSYFFQTFHAELLYHNTALDKSAKKA